MSLLAVPIDFIDDVAQLDWANLASAYTRGTMVGNPVAEWITSPSSRKIVDLDFTLPALSSGQIASLSGVSLAMTLGSSVAGNSLAVMGERDLTPLVMASETAQALYGVGGRWVTFDTIPAGTGDGVITRSLPVGAVLKEDLTYEARRLRLYLKMNAAGSVTIVRPDRRFILQPAATIGKDSYIDSYNHDKKYGDFTYMWMGTSSTSTMKALLEFDLSPLIGKTILSARLVQWVYVYSYPAGDPPPCKISRIGQSWVESQVTWEQSQDGIPWTPGGEFEMEGDAGLMTRTTGSPWVIDQPALVYLCQDAVTNRVGILDIALYGTTALGRCAVYSSDLSDPDFHPRLEISYSDPTVVSPITLTMTFSTNAHIRSQGAAQSGRLASSIQHPAAILSRSGSQDSSIFGGLALEQHSTAVKMYDYRRLREG